MRRRQVVADATEEAAARAAEDAHEVLLTDRAAMGRGDIAALEAPAHRGENQPRAEEVTWEALGQVASAMADPQSYARSGPWVVRGVQIGAMASAPDA